MRWDVSWHDSYQEYGIKIIKLSNYNLLTSNSEWVEWRMLSVFCKYYFTNALIKYYGYHSIFVGKGYSNDDENAERLECDGKCDCEWIDEA